MEQIITSLATYGWQLTLIALLGVIILGILKYSNAFSKIDKEKRKPIYFGISLGFSVISAAIYLLAIKQFDMNYLLVFTATIYAINQTMYAVYETTSLRDLMSKVGIFLKNKLLKSKNK